MKKILFILSILFINHAYSARCEAIDLGDSRYDVGRCEDQTISFDQPSTYKGSSKKGSYEGLCGAVASANVFHAYCSKNFLIPAQIGPMYFYDITPGIRPDTLVRGLNKLFHNNRNICFSGDWHHYYATNRWDFIDRLESAIGHGNSNWYRKTSSASYQVSPVIVLISKNNADTLHYVTVVDVIQDHSVDFDTQENASSCQVFYNDYQRQRSTTCKKFSSWARQVDNSTWTGWMNEYNYFKFVQ